MKAHRGSYMEYSESHKQKLREEAKQENDRTMQAFLDMKKKQMQKIDQLRKRGQ